MCNFLSVLILKNGDVLHHPMLDSHSDLVTYFKLSDTSQHVRHFAKAELTPDDWMDPTTWKWRIDEDTKPRWLTRAVEDDAERKARKIAATMILKDGDLPFIVDGCWILGGKTRVREIRSGWIRRIQDDATISDVRGGTKILLHDEYGKNAVLDESAKAHVATVDMKVEGK